MLESIVRIGEAHARLHFRDEVTIYDAVSVMVLMEHTLNTGLFDILPDVLMLEIQEYQEAKQEVCFKLKLEYKDFQDTSEYRV